MSQIGNNLKNARLAAGMTQKEVESLLGLRALALRDYESERLKLPAELAARFADLYKVSVSDLLSETGKSPDRIQDNRLAEVKTLFRRGPFEAILLDPVIRAYLEEASDKILECSLYELLTMNFSHKAKLDVSVEIMKSLGSLMGIDKKVSESELNFFNELMLSLEIDTHGKTISRAIIEKHLPKSEVFKHPGLKHFLVWLMFFLAQSDGKVTREESAYIEECAEVLRINRFNFLFIKKHFAKESF